MGLRVSRANLLNERQLSIVVGVESVDEHVGVGLRNNFVIVPEKGYQVQAVDEPIALSVDSLEGVQRAKLLWVELGQGLLLELAVPLGQGFAVDDSSNCLQCFIGQNSGHL